MAGEEPQMALKAVAAATVPMANPPGIWPMNLYPESYKLRAIPPLAPIWPIRTKRGMTVKP